MPDELPYMRLWVADLLGDPPVLAMNPEEFGAYMKLLCVAWIEGGIPTDPKARARLLGVTTRKLERLWPAMEGKWESSGNGRLVNPRQERERTQARRLHRSRSAAGKEGAKRRWG